jgi:hypothetical protein
MIPIRKKRNDMKWVNGIEEGKTIETKEKINACDGGGDRTKTKRITTIKAPIKKTKNPKT